MARALRRSPATRARAAPSDSGGASDRSTVREPPAVTTRPDRRRDAASARDACWPSTEIDVRLFGMVVALAVIWIGFHIAVGRRLPDRPQPVEPVGAERLDRHHGDGHGADHRVAQHRPVGRVAARRSSATRWRWSRPSGSPTRSASGSTAGTRGSSPSPSALAARRGDRRRSRASSSPTSGCPSFIVTLGGLLVWRGLIFRYQQGQTLAPLDETFQLLGGGPTGSLGEWRSWLLGGLACAGIAYSIIVARRRRRRLPVPAAPDRRRHRARRARRPRRARRGLGRQQLPVARAARQGVRRRSTASSSRRVV